jgi:uncharacterized membrane protein YfcA
MLEILLPIFGFLIGTVASMAGIGGGAFIVPLLTLVYAFDPANAVGTSLTSIIFTALAATFNYAKQKRIYYKTGLVMALTTAPGAVLGAYLTAVISPRLLGLTFGAFMIFIASTMIIDLNSLRNRHPAEEKSQTSKKSESELFRSGRKLMLGAALSFFGGLSSGLLGIGGGVLIVPIMVFAMDMPMHAATATSMFTMIFTSMSGVTQHYLANHTNFECALLLALGTVTGAQLGAHTSKKISAKNLRRIFGLVLIVVSVQMIWKYLWV